MQKYKTQQHKTFIAIARLHNFNISYLKKYILAHSKHRPILKHRLRLCENTVRDPLQSRRVSANTFWVFLEKLSARV